MNALERGMDRLGRISKQSDRNLRSRTEKSLRVGR
jgi:hypothetical protein